MENLANINRSFGALLPQDGIFPLRLRCPARSVAERQISIDKFFNLYLHRLYASVKGNPVNPSDKLYLSLIDGYSGREIFKRIPITQFSPGFADGMNTRLMDRDNLRHYFREHAPIQFTVENESGNDYVVDLTLLGQRFFTGINQGGEFAKTNGWSLCEDGIGTKGESRRIEYKYLPKPVSFKFVAELKDGIFNFDAGDDVNSGECVAYKLNPLSMYKLSQISISSSLPEGVFAGSVTEKMMFNIRTTKKQSMMALPFGFNSHILPTGIESYLQNRNADDNVFLVGNLYGTVEQTAEIIRLGCGRLSIVVNCVLYEGREDAQ